MKSLLIIINLLLSTLCYGQAMKLTRTGDHVEFNIGSGITLSTPNTALLKISFNTVSYLNHHNAIISGFVFTMIRFRTIEDYGDINYLGIPLNYLWTPSLNSGLFLSFGPTLYIPIFSTSNLKSITLNGYQFKEVGEDLAVGLNIAIGYTKVFNTTTSLNISISGEHFLRPHNQDVNGLLFKIGIIQRLSQKIIK